MTLVVLKTDEEDRPERLVDLAAELGFNQSSVLRVVRRRGFAPFQIQSGQNKPYYLSKADAESLRKKLEDEKQHRITAEEKIPSTGLSGVYVVEVPAYDASVRVKIGWSENITDRLSTYRTIVPDLRVSRIWPCSARWYESMALTWAENNAKRVGQELFELDDNDGSLCALDQLFASLGIKSQAGSDG